MARINIREADIDTAVSLSQQVPEFINPPGHGEYERRLKKVPSLILVAYDGEKAVAFKVGYERDRYFYSWMGGVLPTYRRRGIATHLARKQEEWARKQGYPTVTFKTRNQHKTMLIFALRRGFNIVGFKEKGEELTNRIILRKVL